MEIDLFMKNIIQGGASGSRETENKILKFFFFFLNDLALRIHSGGLSFFMFSYIYNYFSVQLQRPLTYTRI